MMASTKRESTRAVSASVSPRPSCISCAVSVIASPPSWRMATSKETRVRVEGLSKIIASVLPASGFLTMPRARAAFIARLWVDHAGQRRLRDVDEIEEMPHAVAAHDAASLRAARAFAQAACRRGRCGRPLRRFPLRR